MRFNSNLYVFSRAAWRGGGGAGAVAGAAPCGGGVVEVWVSWWMFAASSNNISSFNSAVSVVFLLCLIQIFNLLYLVNNT